MRFRVVLRLDLQLGLSSLRTLESEHTEPVEVAEPPADTTPEQLADTAPETPAEKPQEAMIVNMLT